MHNFTCLYGPAENVESEVKILTGAEEVIDNMRKQIPSTMLVRY